LVQDIMAGAGTSTVLLDGTVSPHDFSMRPSQITALASADIVFAIGLGLDGWLPENGSADYIYLSESPNITLLPSRSLTEFHEEPEFISVDEELGLAEAQAANNPAADDENFTGDADIDAYVDSLVVGASPISQDHDDDHDHDHGRYDQHIWLDPENAVAMVEHITNTLSEADLVNAEIYRMNANMLIQEIERTANQISFSVDRIQSIDLVTTHDSMQYFETAYGLTVIGSMSSGDGVGAGVRTMSGLFSDIGPNSCILVDVSHPEGMVENRFSDIPAVEINPLGSDLIGMPGYYPRLLESLAEALSNCVL
jgi:zinc transport system substrate-binding protein